MIPKLVNKNKPCNNGKYSGSNHDNPISNPTRVTLEDVKECVGDILQYTDPDSTARQTQSWRLKGVCASCSPPLRLLIDSIHDSFLVHQQGGSTYLSYSKTPSIT